MTYSFPPEVAHEFAPCDRCGTEEGVELFTGPDRLHYLPGQFRVVTCPTCGWIRQNPRPTADAIGYYYPMDYANFIGAIEDEPSRLRQWDRRYGILKRRRAVERFQPGGRVLDVGCATGLFLHEMQLGGWEVQGVEPTAEAAAYARERFGLPVAVGRLREAALPAASFDAITFWDVLEHLQTPWADLQEAVRLLKPGGLLVVRIPNQESWEARHFGPLWLGWDLPRHLYFFPRPALLAALEELGLTLVDSRCVATSYAAFMLTLQFYLEERYGREAPWPQRIQRVGRWLPTRVTLAPLFWLLGKTKQASMITYFARRR